MKKDELLAWKSNEFIMIPYEVDIYEQHLRKLGNRCMKCGFSVFINNKCTNCGEKKE